MFYVWYDLSSLHKNLPRRKASDKVLREKAFTFWLSKYSLDVLEFFDKKSADIAGRAIHWTLNNKIMHLSLTSKN